MCTLTAQEKKWCSWSFVEAFPSLHSIVSHCIGNLLLLKLLETMNQHIPLSREQILCSKITEIHHFEVWKVCNFNRRLCTTQLNMDPWTAFSYFSNFIPLCLNNRDHKLSQLYIYTRMAAHVASWHSFRSREEKKMFHWGHFLPCSTEG